MVIKDDVVMASMPYFVKRGIFTQLIQPSLTQTLGPWISVSNAKYSKKLSREKDLMNQLIDQLPKYDTYKQNWHYSIQNWLPFFWKGFSQTTRYTYVIEPLDNLENVFRDFSSSYRNKIRKADKLITVSRDMDLERFFELNKMTFRRQNLSVPYSFDFLRKQDEALKERRSREIFYAADCDGRVHSALYLTWDKLSSYVHLVGEDPELRSSGAGIRLIWEAVRFTKIELGLNCIDFEGSMIEGVEQVRRDCGAQQKPYFAVTRTPSVMLRAIAFLRTIFG